MRRRAMPLRLGVLLGVLVVLSGFCWNADQQAELKLGNGLFSWKSDVLQGAEREKLFAQMETLALTELYQYFSAEVTTEQVQDFLRAAAKHGINVYWLTGSPEWGLDEGGSAMRCV